MALKACLQVGLSLPVIFSTIKSHDHTCYSEHRHAILPLEGGEGAVCTNVQKYKKARWVEKPYSPPIEVDTDEMADGLSSVLVSNPRKKAAEFLPTFMLCIVLVRCILFQRSTYYFPSIFPNFQLRMWRPLLTDTVWYFDKW